jgi:general secretion pathway protein G
VEWAAEHATLERAEALRGERTRRMETRALISVGFVVLLLGAVVVRNLIPYFFKANFAVVKTDITTICDAIDDYAINNDRKYPENLEVLLQPDENGHNYFRGRATVPKDPWGRDYLYFAPTEDRPYRVLTYGADGVRGGSEAAADVDNLAILTHP